MQEDSDRELYDGQIARVVSGFMQVWNRFEATLSKELARVPDRLEGMHPQREAQPNANYELFYRVSSSIYLEDSVTMGELSKTLSVPLSTATRIADWLVGNGYLGRLPDPEDRRVVRVTLTPLGRELHHTIDRYVTQRIGQILSCLSSQERKTLLDLIGKVLFALKEEAG